MNVYFEWLVGVAIAFVVATQYVPVSRRRRAFLSRGRARFVTRARVTIPRDAMANLRRSG